MKTERSSVGESSYRACYASQLNSLVLRADGTINKCTVALSDPMKYLGKISEDGKISIDIDKFKWWTRGNSSGNELELRRPFKASI